MADIPDITGFEERGLRRLSVGECEAFWTRYRSLRPGLKLQRGNHYSRWRAVAGTDLFIACYLTNRSVGLFVRGERGLSLKAASVRLGRWRASLTAELGVEPLSHGCPYLTRLENDTTDPATWPTSQDWLLNREEFYHAVLARIVGGVEMEEDRADGTGGG